MSARLIIFSLALLVATVAAQANLVVFQDNFNTEHGGTGVLNYAGFTKWTVSDGTVDLIGNGFHDFQPGYGLYVDMDGSTGNAGKMLTSTVFNLASGTYTLKFDLAGNHRNGNVESVDVQVGVGNLLSKSFSLAQNAPFTSFSETFSVNSLTNGWISFEGKGGDNIGMLLDNVSLVAVPAPGAALLAMIGLPVVGWVKRRMA